MLGELFKEVPRESFVLASKVSPDDVKGRHVACPGATKENILTKFDSSLKRLQMKYVDILYFHGVSNAKTAMAPQMLEAFSELKKQGKVRFVGMSTHKNEPDIIQAAIDSNFYDVMLITINFAQGHGDKIREKIVAAEKGIGIVAMKTMAGGFSDKERSIPSIVWPR